MPESQIKVDYIHHCGTDLTTVNAARVSFDKESSWEEFWDYDEDTEESFLTYRVSEKDKNLIRYLATHGHYSPFGHSFASFRVTAPIFVRSQLVKHEYLRMNEVSRRYVDSPPEFYTPDVWRKKSTDKKQGSGGEHPFSSTVNLSYEEMVDVLKVFYTDLINDDVAPEQARMVLPQSMMTSWYWSGSLDAFANMCNLRLKPDAQYETRLVAEQISNYMKEFFPTSWSALVNETT